MNSLAAIGDFVRALKGWRRVLFAFVAGLLSALAFAPFGVFPFLLLGFAALVLLIDGAQTAARPVRAAALAGWVFGFGQFLAGLYWIAYAFLVDAADHLWQMPFIMVLLPAGLALLIGAATATASRFWHAGWQRVFLLAACYATAEWVRGWLFTGFPWNLPAYGWGASMAVLQVNAVVGAYGLSLLTVLFGASLALLLDRSRDWIVPAAMTGLFALIWIGGDIRLGTTQIQTVPGVHLRLVQPNVPQQEKYLPEKRATHWNDLIRLSLVKHGAEPTHIIWPEAAPPFLLGREPVALDDVAILTANRVLMTGAVRAEVVPGKKPVFFNSFYIFGHGGRLIATYDKFHLVPFGEYVPQFLQELGLGNVVNMPGSFGFGDGPHTFAIPDAPSVGPLICYEILFPGAVTARERPQWLVNITDDSWFGPPSSTGPKQHLLIARVRAIEEGLPIARDANTGITAMIDPMGRLLGTLANGKTGVLDSDLPRALPETLFAKLGSTIFFLLLVACFAAGLLPRAQP
jgi:apolipoprotein N-acyltransferase